MIGIVNYGMGNLASIRNALDHLCLPNKLFTAPSEMGIFDKIILPGVGAYGEAINRINKSGLDDALREFVLIKKRPLLGICLGMQLLLESSTEHGLFKGLGFVKGEVTYMGDKVTELPVPHIGWNTVVGNGSSLLLNKTDTGGQDFYFVHSYYCALSHRAQVAGATFYGFQFDSVFEAENIFGVQFHPEKSQKAGLALLRNFGSL